MKYRLHLSRYPIGEINETGTNYVRGQYPKGRNVVEWDILDNPIGDAFIKSFNLVSQNNDNWLGWNRYKKHAGWETVNQHIKELNKELLFCIENDFLSFTSADLIDINLTHTDRLPKLNKIHFLFESELLKIQEQQLIVDPVYHQTLERLNKLVHSLEKIPTHGNAEADQFYVVRWNSESAKSSFIPLSDEMYDLFTTNVETGDLFSDFFTVGKDLGHAFHSNDIELVKQQQVKQQSVVSASVAFALNRAHFKLPTDNINSLERQRYYMWCEYHQVELYGYDYTAPMYNLGRAPVATLNSINYDEMEAVFNETPYVCKVEII
jgi:hypothetical protein